MRRLRPAAPLGISIGDRCARGGRRARSDAAPSLRKIVENGRGLRAHFGGDFRLERAEIGMGVSHRLLTLSTRSTGIRPHPKITSPTPKTISQNLPKKFFKPPQRTFALKRLRLVL